MVMVLDCGIFSSGKIYLKVRHSRAVTARAAGADGKEVPTREVFLRKTGYQDTPIPVPGDRYRYLIRLLRRLYK